MFSLDPKYFWYLKYFSTHFKLMYSEYNRFLQIDRAHYKYWMYCMYVLNVIINTVYNRAHYKYLMKAVYLYCFATSI